MRRHRANVQIVLKLALLLAIVGTLSALVAQRQDRQSARSPDTVPSATDTVPSATDTVPSATDTVPSATAGDAKAAVPAAGTPRSYVTETVRGQVVFLSEALERLYGVSTHPAADEASVALELADGALLPIVPDTRGQAFVVDARLRDRPLELLVRRYQGVPMIQVIRLRARTSAGLVEIDYWCDICAIPMYILKPCECCQGETRLREQEVADEAGP